MPATRKITHKPAAKAMTINELEAALADARATGATGSEIPKVRIVFGGGIKEITIEVKSAAAAERIGGAS